MNPSLHNKVALVTGASRKAGIGAAIARELAKAGAQLSLAYYRRYDETRPWPSNPNEVLTLIADLRDLGVRVEGIEVDLAEPGSARRLIDRTHDLFGGLDILVNNAAHSESASAETLDAAGLDQHYAVNVRATALLCTEFARRQPPGRGGRIINLTSGQGLHPMAGELAYAASKGAIDAFTVSLSAELAARGITVNAIDPGPTDTGWMSADLKERLQRHAPTGRVGLPEDAARLVLFLASNEAGWITGQILRSRGGL
jgi:3-oxoacyl-[acyl-carrier protein] reductase